MDYRIRWQQQRRQRRRKRLLIIPAALALAAVLVLLLRNVGGEGVIQWRYQHTTAALPHFVVTPSTVYVAWPSGHIQTIRTVTGWPAMSGPFFSVPEAFNTTPTLADHVLYFGSDSGILRALEARSGQRLWEYDTGAPLRCQPLVTPGKVYVGNQAGRTYCFGALDGKKIWARILEDGVSGQPALVGQVLVVATTRGAIYGLQPDTGKVLWRQDLSGAPDLSAPVFAPVTDAAPLALVGSDLGYLHLLHAATGAVAHEPYYTGGLLRTPAAVDDRIICFGSTDGWLRTISRDGAQPLWAYHLRDPITAGPVIADGRVYAATATRLLALDATSGRLQRSWPGDQFAGDLVVAGRTIFIGTNQGGLMALATP